MVIRMEGMYVCRMKYPMFLLILKLSESLGYEPGNRKQDAVVVGEEEGGTEEARGGKTLPRLKEFQSLHFDNAQG